MDFPVTEYEQERLARIAINSQRLATLLGPTLQAVSILQQRPSRVPKPTLISPTIQRVSLRNKEAKAQLLADQPSTVKLRIPQVRLGHCRDHDDAYAAVKSDHEC